MKVDGNDILKYLFDYKDGKIKQGLKLGIELDNWYVHKPATMNIVLGLDNVGKTIFLLWYFLCLSVKHNLKWYIWSGENNSGQLVRDLIQMYSQTKILDLKKSEIEMYKNKILQWFSFVDNTKLYDHKDLLKIFKESDCDACAIDPFTGLNHDRRVSQYERNYLICNDVREFCNSTGKAVYIMTHPMTEAARRIYPSGDQFEGYVMHPRKADAEGGQVFANRCDSFLTVHRFLDSPEAFWVTQLRIEKIKDKETGGKPTFKDCLSFDYNHGMGFTMGGINLLKHK